MKVRSMRLANPVTRRLLVFASVVLVLLLAGGPFQTSLWPPGGGSQSTLRLSGRPAAGVLPPRLASLAGAGVSIFDEQVGFTLTQDMVGLSYNVTAIKQTDIASGFGPAYLLNGLTTSGYWYQVGLSWNWDPGNVPGTGFNMVFEVFNSRGDSIFPLTGGGGVDTFSGPVNQGDVVLLALAFSDGKVTMSAFDWNTGSSASEKYNAQGATTFVGLPGSIADSNGFFSGLMTEWYHSSKYLGNENEVIYSNTQMIVASAWMWADEFGCSNTQCNNASILFSDNTSSPIPFTNPNELHEFASNGTSEFSNAFDVITGALSPISTPFFAMTPSVIDAGQAAHVRIAVTWDGGSPPYLVALFGETTGSCAGTNVTKLQLGVNPISTFGTSVMFNATATASEPDFCARITDNSTPQSAANSTVALKVRPSVFAAVIPPSSTIIRGSSLTLIAVPSNGTSPYSYQWYTGPSCGNPITGQTSSTFDTGAILNTTSFSVMVKDGSEGVPPATFCGNSRVVVGTLAVSCNPVNVPVGTATVCSAKISSSSRGTVTWTSDGAGVFSSETCKLSVGSCGVKYTPTTAVKNIVTVNASLVGISRTAPTTGTLALDVTPRVSLVAVSCSSTTFILSPSKSVTCRARISGYSPSGEVNWFSTGGSGNVTLNASTCVIIKGTCSITLKGITAGGVDLSANYLGDANNLLSNNTIGLIIRPTRTTLAVSCTPASVRVHDSLECTAILKGSFGQVQGETVTWTVASLGGSTTPSSLNCILSLQESCSVTLTGLTAGKATVVARYVGDNDNGACLKSYQIKIT